MDLTVTLTPEQLAEIAREAAKLVQRQSPVGRRPVSVLEFARITGLSRSKVHRMVTCGQLERVAGTGTRILITASEVERFCK